MASTTEELFKCTAEYNQQFTKLCQPIMNFFGINAVGFIHVNSNGELINTYTNVPWMEHCMEKHYYKDDPCMVNPNSLSSGIAFEESYDCEVYQNGLLKDAVEKYDLCYSCILIEKDKDSYQAFAFQAPKKNSKFVNNIMSSTTILKKMVHHVQQEMNIAGGVLDRYKVDLASMKGDAYHKQPGVIYRSEAENRHYIDVLVKAGLAPENLLKVSLTTQEKRCMRRYLYGETLEQTAKALQLSARTVGSYIENIKNKIGCSSKNELLKAATVLEGLGKI